MLWKWTVGRLRPPPGRARRSCASRAAGVTGRRLVQEHVGGAHLVRRVGIAAGGQRQSVLLGKRGGPPVYRQRTSPAR